MIRQDLENLKETDIYSILLFAIYKLMPIPEYASLSEMTYVLDKENLLNLCEMFGGQTIRIPTIEELESLVYSLLLYQYVKLDKMDYDAAINLIGHESKELRAVKANYRKLCEVLSDYEFKPRQ